MKGISAVIATILMLMITIALAGVAYMYISGIFTAKTGVVIEFDATATKCSSTAITVYLRNTGTITTTLNLITVSGTNSAGGSIAGGPCAGSGSLNPGAGSSQCTVPLTGTAGTNTILASGPTNTARGTVYCPG
jgi:flagellin-like protein